jgi:hypothetical protein
MRWAGHVTRVAEKNAYRVWVGKPEGERQLGRSNVGVRTILQRILEKWDGVVWAGFIWFRIGTSGGL